MQSMVYEGVQNTASGSGEDPIPKVRGRVIEARKKTNNNYNVVVTFLPDSY